MPRVAPSPSVPPELAAVLDEFCVRLIEYQRGGRRTWGGASPKFGVSKEDLAARMLDASDATRCTCKFRGCGMDSDRYALDAPLGRLCYDHMVVKRVWPRIDNAGVLVRGGAYRLKKVRRKSPENPTTRDRIIAVQA